MYWKNSGKRCCETGNVIFFINVSDEEVTTGTERPQRQEDST